MQKSGKLELTWVGKYEQKEIEPRILVENPDLSYGDQDTGNMLIHGDNLIALKALGLDYASHSFYVDSQGREANYPKFYRNAQVVLSREQRKLSLMKYGSNNYEKQRVRVAKIQEHIANQRKDWLHKLSFELAELYDYICVEDINMQNMAQSLNPRKSPTYDREGF